MPHLRIIATGALVAAALFVWSGVQPAHAVPATLPAAQVQRCTADGVEVSFGWLSNFAGPQWLDLSLSDNGFRPGTFVGIGPLSAGSGRFVWDGLLPGRLHFARVNTLSAGGWQPSETSVFFTRSCTSEAAVLSPVRAVYETAATFQWAPASPPGIVQRLDLSTSTSFAPGTFVSVGPLGPDVSSLFWTGLRPATTHYWRVNTSTGTYWSTSATGTFRTRGVLPPPPPTCHPSYVPCLRADAFDYDCAGGSGNGPYYTGRVIVIGPDVFDLDRDGDGVGCE